jgi:hypothetical protein
MRVGTFKLVIEYYDHHTNHPLTNTFSGISRSAVKRYLAYYSRKYAVKSWMMLDRPDGLVSF